MQDTHAVTMARFALEAMQVPILPNPLCAPMSFGTKTQFFHSSNRYLRRVCFLRLSLCNLLVFLAQKLLLRQTSAAQPGFFPHANSFPSIIGDEGAFHNATQYAVTFMTLSRYQDGKDRGTARFRVCQGTHLGCQRRKRPGNAWS
jgi:hypothetical protein